MRNALSAVLLFAAYELGRQSNKPKQATTITPTAELVLRGKELASVLKINTDRNGRITDN